MSQGGAPTRVSTGSNGGNDPCGAQFGGITPDGLNVFFLTDENLTPDDLWNPDGDCFSGFSDQGSPDIHQWSNGSVVNRTPALNAFGAPDLFATASLDGSRVVYNATIEDCNDLDVYLGTGASHSKLSPSQWDGQPHGLCANGRDALFAGASADATKVYWITYEEGMAGASDDHKDIFLSTNGGAGQLVSPNTPNGDANPLRTTADGHMFFSTSDPVTDDGDTSWDVFQYFDGTITKISKGPLGGDGAYSASFSGVSDDADFAFFTTAEPLTEDDQDTSSDLFVRHGSETELISTGSRATTSGGNFAGISEDAERVFFTSYGKHVSADTDQEKDVYMRWVGGPPAVRIDEFALTPDPYVELLKSGEGQDEFPTEQGPYKIVVYDGNGDKTGEHVITPSLLRGQARPLFSDTHPNKDEPLEVALPSVGQICFTQGIGEVLVDCVSWGCVANPVQPELTNVAAPGANLSQQRQSDNPEIFHLASPTPKAVSIAGTTPPACPSDPDPDPDPDPGPGPGGDTTSPNGRASGKGTNKAGKTTKIEVSSNENVTVAATGIQQQTSRAKKNGSRTRTALTVQVAKKKGGKKLLKVKLKRVNRDIPADRKVTLKLKPKGKKAANKLRKAVKKGSKAKAKITVTFEDPAGNKTTRKLAFSLR